MGLDCSHGAWRGPQSAFSAWRETIAKFAGLPPLERMEGYCNDDDGGIPWASIKPNPLHILLDHSDKDGEIDTEDCGPIAAELEKLLHLIEGHHGAPGFYPNRTQQFIDGLRRASDAGEDLEFY